MDNDLTIPTVAQTLKQLTLTMARAVVQYPDRVQVDLAVNNEAIALQLSVDPTDKGRVIGRGGRVANAMRTLLQHSAAQTGHRVYLDIIDG